MRGSSSEEFARENCVKGGCARVSSNGQECKHCGFDAGEFKRRRELPLEELPNGLRGKRVGREKVPNEGALEKTEAERVC